MPDTSTGNGRRSQHAGATHLRLLAQNTATVGLHFHGHAATTVDLSWAAGSHRVAVPSGIFAALVERVDAGRGDVSLVCERAARGDRRPAALGAGSVCAQIR